MLAKEPRRTTYSKNEDFLCVHVIPTRNIYISWKNAYHVHNLKKFQIYYFFSIKKKPLWNTNKNIGALKKPLSYCKVAAARAPLRYKG